MHASRRLLLMAMVVATCSLSTSCIWRKTASLPPLEINLFVGIDRLARLNDSEKAVEASSLLTPKRFNLDPGSELASMRFTHGVSFEEAGLRVYFRNGRVVLIEVQEPFRGSIHGRKLNLFPLMKAPQSSWEETLLREFGQPLTHATGGRFGSEALFYAWGDISFNGAGPNQIALYRDLRIANYRQKNFGRVLELFPLNKP